MVIQCSIQCIGSRGSSFRQRCRAGCARRAGARQSEERAAEFARRAWASYGPALRKPLELGSCSERSTVRYNAACAAARCGAAGDALGLLQQVAAKDAAALRDAGGDNDLELLRSAPEFAALMKQVMG